MVADTPKFWRARWAALAPLAAMYATSLPRTVQSLDAGELVASAWRLTVPHPPGYPLYVWLQHGAMSVVPWGSVFHRAAFANSLCMLGACALLIRLCRDWLGVVLVVVMGTLPLIWRYAVLPDVFALHLLLASALLAVAFAQPTPRRTFAGALVFGLAAANHQTIIFLAPLLGWVAFEDRSKRRAAAALALGFVVTVALYASLMMLDTDNIVSWGKLDDAHDLLRHFLRRDYGSLALSGHESGVDLVEVVTAFAASTDGLGIAASVCVAAGAVRYAREWRAHRAWWLLLVCTALYLVVILPASNLGPHPIAVAIRERFFLFPILLVTALAVRAPLITPSKAWLKPALVVALAVVALVQASIADTRQLTNDTVVEDYARNLLNSAADARTPAILLVDSDTKAFATRYVQATEPGYDNIVILSRGNMFDARTLAKIKRRYPQFTFDPDVVKPGGARDIFRQFIVPNMENFALTYVMPTTSPRGHTVFYPLGRRVEPGTGSAIADNAPPPRVSPPVYHADAHGYVETKDLYSEYAIYHLARGRLLLEQGDREAARQAFLAGLAVVPYCIPCLRNVCALDEGDSDCAAALRELEENEYDYFR